MSSSSAIIVESNSRTESSVPESANKENWFRVYNELVSTLVNLSDETFNAIVSDQRGRDEVVQDFLTKSLDRAEQEIQQLKRNKSKILFFENLTRVYEKKCFIIEILYENLKQSKKQQQQSTYEKKLNRLNVEKASAEARTEQQCEILAKTPPKDNALSSVLPSTNATSIVASSSTPSATNTSSTPPSPPPPPPPPGIVELKLKSADEDKEVAVEEEIVVDRVDDFEEATVNEVLSLVDDGVELEAGGGGGSPENVEKSSPWPNAINSLHSKDGFHSEKRDPGENSNTIPRSRSSSKIGSRRSGSQSREDYNNNAMQRLLII